MAIRWIRDHNMSWQIMVLPTAVQIWLRHLISEVVRRSLHAWPSMTRWFEIIRWCFQEEFEDPYTRDHDMMVRNHPMMVMAEYSCRALLRCLLSQLLHNIWFRKWVSVSHSSNFLTGTLSASPWSDTNGWSLAEQAFSSSSPCTFSSWPASPPTWSPAPTPSCYPSSTTAPPSSNATTRSTSPT